MSNQVAEMSATYLVEAARNAVPVGYKQTEVGIIPEDWEVVFVGDVCNLLTGFPFPSSKYSDSGVRLLRGSNVKRGCTDWSDEITQHWPEISPTVSQYELIQGDIVISMDGSLVGRSFAQLKESDLPALLLQRVARLRSAIVSQSYLKEWVCSKFFTEHCDSVKTVTAIPHISPQDIRSFAFLLPPTKKEQTAIANTLSDVDALISELEKLVAKKQAIKTATMQQLLTGRTRLPQFAFREDGTPKGYKQSELGEMPEDWEVIPLSSLLGYEQPTKYIVRNTKFLSEGMYPVLTAGKSFILGFTNEDHSVYQKLPVIIFDDFTTDAKYVDFPFKVKSSAMKMLKSKNENAPLGLIFHLLNNINFVVGDHKRHWISEYQNFSIVLPSNTVEQTTIATTLSDMDEEIQELQQRLGKTRQLKQGMMQELLTGKTRLVAPAA